MRRFFLQTVLFITFSAAAVAQCTFTVNPSVQTYTDSLGYLDTAKDPLVVQVTASTQTCAWAADSSDGFATVSGAATGTGNGSVTYSVPANTTGVARSVVLHVAGNAVTLTQKATASTFADEPLSDSFFDGINLMRTNAITNGCTPTNYCPNANVTRDQMAVFIVRTILGGGPGVDNFQYSSTPYFTDVPPTYQYFKWIQKMRELGITSGTTATTYGPLLAVTRGQMAVFIVRARLGTSTVFTYNPTPYFTDVPTNYPFFKWIQKLKEIGITSGTTPTTYSPDAAVTRGQMAVFLIRGGFNTLLNPALPLITSAAPNHGVPGTSVSVAVIGINTHFASDTTILADNGVTGSKPVVTDATHLTTTLTIPANTPLGQISITAETLSASSEEATLPNGFTVGTGDPVPTITSFAPASGPIGTSVTLTGTTLVSGVGTPVSVLVPLQGGGLTGAPVESATASSITFVIPSTAASGKITLSSASGPVTSATSFTIVPSSTYTISAAPSTANVIAGQTATYTVAASSSSGFSGLAQLTLSGLPAGVTGTFSPAQISVGEQSILTISAPANQPTSTANLVINANAVVEGIAVPSATNVTLNVTPITTSFLGRTVVDDAANTSLVGVTVTMLSLDGSGHTTACTGSTVSDGSGNFALTNLPTTCIGPQLIGFGGNNVTSPAGKYAGVNLVFTLVSNQVVVSPVLVHMPRTDNLETFYVKQNAIADQSYSFKSIPGLAVTVYAGTVITAPDGSIPDPFPFSAVKIAIDRLPDVMPVTSATVTAFIVSFPPANTTASQPVAVWFPNTLNTPPGTSMPLMTLNPTLGRMAPYGTGMVSNDGTTVVPDIDPSTGTLYHRYGISHFDWHGNSPPGPPKPKHTPDKEGASSGEPVDLSSGIETMGSVDIALTGSRGGISVMRTYVTLDPQSHSFGIGAVSNYDYTLDSSQPQSAPLINLTEPNGAQIPFSRIADGTLVNQTVPDLSGDVMTTAADGTVVLRQKTGATFTFKPGGPGAVMTAIGDPNGNVTTIVRDANAYIKEIDDPVGRKLVFASDSSGRIVSITDPIGRKVSYTYDAAGCLATYTNVLGGVTAYLYDSQNRLTRITDPNGIVQAQYVYDANGRVSQQIVSSGGSYTYAYTLINPLVPTSPVLQTQETDPNGSSWIYRFNSDGYVVSAIDPLGQTRTIDRQTGTNLILGYHGNGTCSVCGDPTSGDIAFQYDSSGNLISQTDALGNTTLYTWDPVFSNLTSITDPLGNVTTLAYDARGNLISLTDARNHTVTFTTNTYGEITAIKNATGQTVGFSWDTQGNLVKTTDPAGLATTYIYDAVSRPVRSVDPASNQSSVAWNALDQLVSATDEDGNTTSFQYDSGGRPLSYTDPKGGVISLTYDSAGHLASRKDQQNRVTTINYDLNNNVVSATNRFGTTVTFTHDALGRFLSEQFNDGTKLTASYDAAGRRSRMVDSVSGVFESTYDAAGRLTRSSGPFGAISYAMNAAGFVTSRQVAGQPEVDYTFDAVQNLTSATTTGAAISFAYDANDNVAGVTRSNGVNGAYTFDNDGRLTSITEQTSSASILARNLSFDPAGHIASQTVESGAPISLQSSASTYNVSNQLTGSAGSTFTYDANGNRISETSAAGTTSYTWDVRGRLQAIAAPGGVITAFLYDYNSNLIQKRVTSSAGDVIERYLLDDMTNIAEQQTGSGTPVNLLTGRSPDSHFATVSGASTTFGIADYGGSVAALTSQSGAITGRFNYGPYGQTDASGASFPVEFNNRQQVAQNLYYFRARYLDARNGNFLSEDPTGLAGGDANLYRYAAGDPLDFGDPSGTIGLPRFAAAPELAVGGFVVGYGASLAGTALSNYMDGRPLMDSSQYNPYTDALIAGGVGAITAVVGSKIPPIPGRIGGIASNALLGAGSNIAQTMAQNIHHNISDGNAALCNVTSGTGNSAVFGAVGGALAGATPAVTGGAFINGFGKVAMGATARAGVKWVGKNLRGGAGSTFGDITVSDPPDSGAVPTPTPAPAPAYLSPERTR